MPQTTSRLWAVLTGSLFALVGLAYIILGGWLAYVGGPVVFILFGVGFLLSGVLLLRRRLSGVWLYLLVFLGCVGWSLWEVGLDGWQLMPRLLVVAVLGVWISLPWVIRQLTITPSARRRAMAPGLLYMLTIAAIFVTGWHISDTRFLHHQQFPAATAAQMPPGDADWKYYGRTADGQRFSPQMQITPQNVGQLKQAWRFDSGDVKREGEDKAGREFNLEVTPVKVGNVLARNRYVGRDAV